MPTRSSLRYLFWAVYILSGYWFVRFYVVSTEFYLKMDAYLTGHERLPFQERILPAVLMRIILSSHYFVDHAHRRGAFSSPETGAFFILSVIGFALASVFCVKLYRAVSTRGTFEFLVFPLFLYCTMWSYSLRLMQNYSYPYDLFSLAFFTAGMYFIYTRQFFPLAAVMLVGTVNRETTMFLILLYILDATSVEYAGPDSPLRQRFDLRRIPWLRAALLSAIWLAIKLTLAHLFAHNDASEQRLRLKENFYFIRPWSWPDILNICGYLLPVMVVLRRRIQPIRFANYVYLILPWILAMVVIGLLNETRIYGELCPLVAVGLVLELEDYAAQIGLRRESRKAGLTPRYNDL